MIEVKNLTKKYGDHTAVKNLSFTVESGTIYGFLGPNGAGKSTTMNILTGCLSATEGEVLINGHDIFEDAIEAKKCIGYLPEQPPLYLDMTPLEYLSFVAKAKGLSKAEREDQIVEVMQVTGIEKVAHRLMKHLSKGYRQRVGIAQALLGNPEIIILDEPTVGLDPMQIIEIRELITKLGKNHTVILSSHILSEVSAVCSHIMIISKGELVASDTPKNLEAMFQGTSTLRLTIKGTEAQAKEIADAIESIDSTLCRPGEDGQTYVQYKSHADRDFREEVFFAYAERQIPILAMSIKHVSLEDVFLQVTQEDKTAKEVPVQEENHAEETKTQAEPEESTAVGGEEA